MPRSGSLFILISILLFSCVCSLAQKSDLKPLAPNATLPETQSWLVGALRRSGNIPHGRLENKMPEVTFNGCQMSFTATVNRRLFYMSPMPAWQGDFRVDSGPRQIVEGPATLSTNFNTNAVSGNNSYLDNLNPPAAPHIKNRLVAQTQFSFDLKEMDRNLTITQNIALLGGEKPAALLVLGSRDPIVKIVEVIEAATPVSAFQRSAGFTLRPEDAPVIKNALHRVITLCQTGN
jgi:hypothetical protein